MQVLSIGAVELLNSSFDVDLDPGLSSYRVKPESDVSAGSLNQGRRVWTLNIFLEEFGEVINLSEENDPAVIGGIVLGNLSESVEPLFREGRWEVLFDIVSVHRKRVYLDLTVPIMNGISNETDWNTGIK